MNDQDLFNRAPLTKKLLMKLPEGYFIASNCADHQRNPIFQEGVVSERERGMQWERIKHAKANGRHCNVFRNKAAFARWHDQVSAI
jgi:hypothetical protein